MKIYITGQIPDIAVKFLRNKKFNVSINKDGKQLTKKEIIENATDADGIITLLSDKIDSQVINKLPKCKVIANYAVGFNNIDIEFARKKNIVVTNTPDVLTDSTADLAMALTLACCRRISEAEKYVRNRNFTGWKPQLFLGTELKGKIFGILGAGRIGTATALRAKAFGMKILYYSSSMNPFLEKNTGAKKTSLVNLLKKADIISVHLPLNKDTFHLIDNKKLKLLKKNSFIINTARGEIIEEVALLKMLRMKRIRGAGFDVYENEPNLNEELFMLDNVVLLPHIGSATEEARNKMALLAAKNVINVLTSKKAITPVPI